MRRWRTSNRSTTGSTLIAMPPAIPFPGYYRHDSADRPGHPDITYVEATYSPASTPGLVHEIAETITNPRYREHKAWVDDCDCELVDRCGPPPPGDSTPATLLVGESATANYQVPSMWSDAKNNGFGGCALSYTPDVNYYFVDGAGSLNHIWGALFGWGAIDDYGHPAGVTLSTLYSLAGPGAASWRKNRDDVFAVDSTGNVAHLWWDHPSTPGWNSWAKPTSYNVIYPPDASFLETPQSGCGRHRTIRQHAAPLPQVLRERLLLGVAGLGSAGRDNDRLSAGRGVMELQPD